MKKLIIIAILAFTLTSCYMPPRFMQSNPYYDGYYVGSNSRYASTNSSETVINGIANDINKQLDMIIKEQKNHAGEKLSLTVEFYAVNHNVDQKLHEAIIDKVSYELHRMNKGKYNIIYPDAKVDEEFEKENLQTNEGGASDLEKDLMKEYDPGVKITISTTELSSGQIEVKARILLSNKGEEVLNKSYKIYPDDRQNQVSSPNNSTRITTTYYTYSVPLYSPAYYYWYYPGYYWGWNYPHYRYSTRYWYYRPYYRTYRSPSYKTPRSSRGYYHN